MVPGMGMEKRARERKTRIITVMTTARAAKAAKILNLFKRNKKKTCKLNYI